MKLTQEQRDSVTTIDGNVVCMASAGSGKTHSFVTRIAYMIKNGIEPDNILGLTFTKKSAEEMQKRLSKMIGKGSSEKVELSTFHSLAYKLLKKYDDNFSKFNIIPDWQKFSWLSDICKPIDSKNKNGMNLGCKAGELAQFISYQKSNMIKPNEELLVDEHVYFVRHISKNSLNEAYSKFEELKSNSRLIDFDDMLLMLYDKLKADDDFRNEMSNKYKYIMIDEGQDTSLINMEIVKLINNKNVYLVGDFRQSIYSFINARVDNILDFKHEFENVKVIELNKNFRSTQNIVELSNNIISNSPIQKYKQYKPSESVSDIGEPVKITLYSDEHKQFDDIVDKIEAMNNEGHKLSEIAILVRTNAQTAIIEDKLANKDIPFVVSKATSFFDRKEILDILSYARVAVDEEDDISFRRIYNTPNRYLSKNFIEELDKFASEKDITLFHAIQITPRNNEWKYRNNIEKLTNIINELKYQVETEVNAGRFLRNIVRLTRYNQYIDDNTNSASSIDEKKDAIDRLCAMASKFPNIKSFLAYVGTIKDKQEKSKGKDAVQIITIHSAKGLEWDTVFVPNVNDENFPHPMNADIEEERRLLYVAVSRPRKRLYISWCVYNRDVEIKQESPFITELLGDENVNDMKRHIFNGDYRVEYDYDLKIYN